MRKQPSALPCCPGCGYEIFGIRDMRCPECGRELSVLDFNPDTAARHGESQRYERNAALGGVVGFVFLLAALGAMLLLFAGFFKLGFLSLRLMLLIGLGVIGFVAVWACIAAANSSRGVWSWLRGR